MSRRPGPSTVVKHLEKIFCQRVKRTPFPIAPAVNAGRLAAINVAPTVALLARLDILTAVCSQVLVKLALSRCSCPASSS
jgi:hypothetical protein